MEPSTAHSDHLISQAASRLGLVPSRPVAPAAVEDRVSDAVADAVGDAVVIAAAHAQAQARAYAHVHADAHADADVHADTDAAVASPLMNRVAFHHDQQSAMQQSAMAALSRNAFACDASTSCSTDEFGLDTTPPAPPILDQMPNEVLFHILGYLDVNDLLSASRTSHLFRMLSCSPILHYYRLQRTRSVLPPLLSSPSRPSLSDLIRRSIFLTKTTVVSRRLARSLVSIRLSRHLAARPSAVTLVERSVLPQECVPGRGIVHVAPGIVARRKAIEKERVKDGLRRWIAAKWRGEVEERERHVRRWEESRGVGRVWRLRRFWERVSKGEEQVAVAV